MYLHQIASAHGPGIPLGNGSVMPLDLVALVGVLVWLAYSRFRKK